MTSCQTCGGRMVPYSDVTLRDGDVHGMHCALCGREPARSAEVIAHLMAEVQPRRRPQMPQGALRPGSRVYQGSFW